jgi:hypothetical protein
LYLSQHNFASRAFCINMKNFLTGLLLFALASCTVPHKELEQGEVSFKTSDASVLFFKNVRQLYYDREYMPAGKIDIYRISKRNKEQHQPVINLAIANNWRHSEAYLLIEPNDMLADLARLEVAWTTPAGDTTGSYIFSYGPKGNHFHFANQIHKSILQQHSLKIKVNDSTSVDFLNESTDREAFRKTMLDYYRLIELDR